MMIAATVTCLFVIAGLVSVLSLLDTWVKARDAFWRVFRQRQLLDAGFVPQVEASELRLRARLHNNASHHAPLHRTARHHPAPRRVSGFAGARRSNLGAVQELG